MNSAHPISQPAMFTPASHTALAWAASVATSTDRRPILDNDNTNLVLNTEDERTVHCASAKGLALYPHFQCRLEVYSS